MVDNKTNLKKLSLIKPEIDRMSLNEEEIKRIRLKIKRAVRNKSFQFGIGIQITGEWLIEHGLSEDWYKLRGMDKWKNKPGTQEIVDGKITKDFVDYLFFEQAEIIGIIERY